ncbi:Protein O-linked-mannose beta-1,2-N-acetylglucosaminyltransferase 1 [Portunus trituberculatus]|uniref:Protein O-linked-mannose beta-1,2-N-acetylglucosaminyltransferase 1 n=1 Tax=Portunus trituberculatus TaxID=210409 RepID=A0A5B7CU10_PORTR|nr:Protein O-linked-mannose beta-1,2-N-acetylglucosaminyltransferase 1 [Portunus trituberculatus]
MVQDNWCDASAYSRVFSGDVVSAEDGASVGVSCLQEECDWRGWSDFSSFKKVTVFHPGEQDGLVMTVLHETTGVVLLRKTFRTWHIYSHALDLVWWVGRLRAGRVVVLVVRGSGTYGLGDAISALTDLGSLLARHAPPSALLAWAFIVGGRTLLETMSPYHRPSNISLHAHFLLPAAPILPVLPRGLVPVSQERVCDSQAALGPLCDPVAPLVMTLSLVEDGQKEEGKGKVGVVVCAGGRFQYLAHTLVKLLHNRGLAPHHVIVVFSGLPTPEVLTFLELLHLRHSVVDVPLEVPSINHRLFKFYREAWRVGVVTFPDVLYLAFLDEDVEVSPDWLSLLLHLAPALTLDSSLWCVTGSGSPHPAQYRDPRRVIRAGRQPGWGYLVLAAEARSVVGTWPDAAQTLLYDTFLMKTVGRGRECVFPMLARSRHYGVGVNTEPEIHHFYFLGLPLHDGSPAILPPPETLTQQQYDSQMWARLRAAVPVTRNPCAPGFLRAPDDGPPTDLVFFFFMDNLKNSLEWAMLGECVGAWPYSTQAMHRGTVELPQAWGGSMWLVGVPASPYHTLRPPAVPTWRPVTDRQLEEHDQYFSSLRPRPNLTARTMDAALSHLFLSASLPKDDKPGPSLAATDTPPSDGTSDATPMDAPNNTVSTVTTPSPYANDLTAITTPSDSAGDLSALSSTPTRSSPLLESLPAAVLEGTTEPVSPPHNNKTDMYVENSELNSTTPTST